VPVRAPAARSSLADRAYHEIKALLQNGVFAPGSFLSERQLAKQLGMSKTPVKSALVRLEMEGFLSVAPQQGIVVREMPIHEILDLFDIRIALESFVVRRIAGRLLPEQAVRLKENLRGQSVAVRKGDQESSIRLDTEFHTLLCEFSGNREITEVMLRLRDKLHRIIFRIQRLTPQRLAAGVREHAQIAQAVFQGKGDLAARRVVDHLEVGKHLVATR
jgi:DNA-binding GntR family transcriptional regulator